MNKAKDRMSEAREYPSKADSHALLARDAHSASEHSPAPKAKDRTSNAREYLDKAKSYALLARAAHSPGERELMLRLQQSCLSLARNEERIRIEREANGATHDGQ